jgi:hypothetical protein
MTSSTPRSSNCAIAARIWPGVVSRPATEPAAHAEAEDQAPAGEQVQSRGLLGEQGRFAQRRQQYLG